MGNALLGPGGFGGGFAAFCGGPCSFGCVACAFDFGFCVTGCVGGFALPSAFGFSTMAPSFHVTRLFGCALGVDAAFGGSIPSISSRSVSAAAILFMIFLCEAVGLAPGALYVSALDPNIENGEVEIPIRPMLRAAERYVNATTQQTLG